MQGMTSEQAKRYVFAQLIATILISCGSLLIGWTAAYSGLAGGLIATLTTAWFAAKVFGTRQDEDPATILKRLYLGEINKLLITASLFIMAFVLIDPVNAAALLAVYFLVYMLPFVLDYFVADDDINIEDKEES